MVNLQNLWRKIREKHFKIAGSSGSLGIIGGAIFLVLAIILLFFPTAIFGGLITKGVIIIAMFLVPLLNL